MRVLVTGGAGFIGSHLVEALLARGDEVVVVDNFDPYYNPRLKRRNLEGVLANERCKLVEGDVTEVRLVNELFAYAHFDAVVHFAALAGVRESIEQPHEFNDVNTGGTITLLEAAVQHGKPRFILASTSSVYGSTPRIPCREDDPLLHCISPYGASKIAAERYAYIAHVVQGLPVVALRFFTAYGPRQRPDMAIHLFAQQLLKGQAIALFGDGSTSRDYTYIDDIIGGVLAALDSDIPWGIFNLGNSQATTLAELVEQLAATLELPLRVQHYPEQAGDPPHTLADISRARDELGYAPGTQLAEGLKHFAEWFHANQDLLSQ